MTSNHTVSPSGVDHTGGPAGETQPSLYRLVWAYGRHELLYVCWALMEIALIAPLALVMLPWTYFWSLPVFISWLTVLVLVPFNLSRLLSLAAWPLTQQRRILVVAFLLILLIALRSLVYEPQSLFDAGWLGQLFRRATTQPGRFWQRDLTLFALLALLWWRGLSMARRHVLVPEIGFRMRLGGLLLAPLVVIQTLIPNAPPALPFVMLFFLAALIAIALTRAEEVSRQNEGAAFGMNVRWIGTVFGASFFVVSISALVGLALSGRGLQHFLQWLSPLWNALALGGMVVVTTSTYFLLFLLAPLQWALRSLFALFASLGVEGLPEIESLAPELTDPSIDQLILDLGDTQSIFFVWANRGAMVLFVLFVLLILAIALRRTFNRRAMPLEYDESTVAPPTASGESAGFGRRIWNRLERWRRWRAAATVRQLYRAMSVEAAARGFPRPHSQTPYEYLPALREAWPAGVDDVALITGAYVRVRYGEIPESAEELETLRAAWRRLAQAPTGDE